MLPFIKLNIIGENEYIESNIVLHQQLRDMWANIGDEVKNMLEQEQELVKGQCMAYWEIESILYIDTIWMIFRIVYVNSDNDPWSYPDFR